MGFTTKSGRPRRGESEETTLSARGIAGLDGTQFTFGYRLANGVVGIAVASFVVPEPSTWALALGTLGLLGVMRQSRRAVPRPGLDPAVG